MNQIIYKAVKHSGRHHYYWCVDKIDGEKVATLMNLDQNMRLALDIATLLNNAYEEGAKSNTYEN